MGFDTNTTVVIDNGSGQIKAGLAGEEMPRIVSPNIVGRTKHKKVLISNNERDEYVGDEAIKRRGMLILSYPIRHGKIMDWDDMAKIWTYLFYNQLRVDSESCNVLMTEAPHNPKLNREKMIKWMFEEYGVPGCYIAIQAVLSLYAAGRTTGVVLDSGDGVTHTVPVYEGYSGSESVRRLDVAGRDVTSYLIELLRESGYDFNTTSSKHIVGQIKEAHAKIAMDIEETRAEFHRNPADWTVSFELPDGNIISVGLERFECGESLFYPSLVGSESSGTSDLLNESIENNDYAVIPMMRSNVILSGGTTCIEDYPQRVERDLKARVPKGQVVVVLDTKERKYSVWIGGSIMASLSTFCNCWITKSEYDESGPAIVHRKCQ